MSDVFDLTAQILVSMGNTEQQLSAAQKQVKTLEDRLKSLEGQQKKTSHGATEHASILDHILGHSVSDVTSKVQGLTHETGILGSVVSVAGGELAGLGGPIGLVVGGLAAIIATAAAAGTAVFELAEKTAEYGESIYKAQQKTGLSVETLQALKLAGHEVGMELETMSTGLVRFTNNLNAADTGNKAMAAFFKSQNVTAFHNSDEALSQYMEHFAKLPSDQDRVLSASKAFGARFGASLIEVFHQVGGDMDAFKEKLSEQGVLMSEEGVESSHDFTVALHELENQFASITRQVGTQTLPSLSVFFEIMSHDLANSSGEWKGWGDILEYVLIGVEASWLGFLQFISAGVTQIEMAGHNLANGEFVWALKDIAGLMNTAMQGPSGFAGAQEARIRGKLEEDQWARDLSKGITDGLPKNRSTGIGGGGGGGHAKAGPDPAAEARKLASIRLKGIIDGYKGEEDALKRSLDMRWISLQKFTDDSWTLEDKRHQAVLAGLRSEADEAAKLKKGSAVALAEIDLKGQEEQRRHWKAIGQFQDTLNKDTVEQTRMREESIMRILDTSGETQKSIWQQLADQHVITAEQAAQRIGAIEMASLQRQYNEARIERDRAGADKTKELAARLKMGEIEAQMGALGISTEMKVNDAKRATLETQRQFNLEMEKTLSGIRDQGLEIQKQEIQRKLAISGPGQNNGRTDAAARAIDAINLQQENARYEISLREETEKQLQLVSQTSLDNMEKVWATYYKNLDSMEEQHQENIKQIQARALIETRQRVEQLAGSLTSVIDSALSQGFQSGIKAGLLEFAKGILDIIRNQALKNLESAIADAIMKGMQGAQAGGGSSGIWSMLFGILMGGLSGGMSHGASGGSGPAGAKAAWLAGGGLADGGQAFAGQPVMVGDRADRQPEIFMPRTNGHVFTQDQFRAIAGDMLNQRGGGSEIHNHFHTWNVQTPNPASFNGRDTQAQVQRGITRTIGVSKVRTGG